MKVWVIGSTGLDGVPLYYAAVGRWVSDPREATQIVSRPRAQNWARYIQDRPILYDCHGALATPICCQAQALEVDALPPEGQRA